MNATQLLTRALEIPTGNLGLDLDGTIDENPMFFGVLSRLWPAKVYVVTYRDNPTKAKQDVDALSIRYDEIILVNSFAQKAEVIKERNITVYFDDMDEVITHIPESVTVLKVRNGGNFAEGKWLYSKHTGKLM